MFEEVGSDVIFIFLGSAVEPTYRGPIGLFVCPSAFGKGASAVAGAKK